MVKIVYANPLTDTNIDTFTNKNINLTNNVVTDTSTAQGDTLKSNGTKFSRLAMGSANQVLSVNAAGTDVVWVTRSTRGETIGSGNAVLTSFTIPHGLGVNPSAVSVDPMTVAAAATYFVTHDATNITVTYSAAPANVANNLQWSWVAFI